MPARHHHPTCKNGADNSHHQETLTRWKEYCYSLTEERVLECGLEFSNYTKKHQDKVNIETNWRRFGSHFGVGAKAVTALVKDLPLQWERDFKLYDLFISLSFAKMYNTEEVHARNWRVWSNKVKNCVKCYFRKIQLLKSKKIYIGNFENETIYTFTVDGVHCHTKECRINPTTKVYSHKFYGPGIAYEVGIAIYKDCVLWIKGPFLLQHMMPLYSKAKMVFTRIYRKEREE